MSTYYLTGMCKECGARVWVNLDGSCASGHPDSSVGELDVPYPEQLRGEEFAPEPRGADDPFAHMSITETPRAVYDRLSAMEPNVTNPVTLHFVYNWLIDATYRLRNEHPNWLDWCIEYCKRDIALFPQFRIGWIADERSRYLMSAAMFLEIGERRDAAEALDEAKSRLTFDLLVPSFKQLAIIYEKQERFEQGIEVASAALAYGLRDGTQGGYVGRIDRMKRKQAAKK